MIFIIKQTIENELLKFKTFLTTHNATLSDIFLTTVLFGTYKDALTKELRDQIPNVIRHFLFMKENPLIKAALGKADECKSMAEPIPFKEEKEETKKETKKDKKEAKKEAKKDDKKDDKKEAKKDDKKDEVKKEGEKKEENEENKKDKKSKKEKKKEAKNQKKEEEKKILVIGIPL